jgi:hypothetical protein
MYTMAKKQNVHNERSFGLALGKKFKESTPTITLPTEPTGPTGSTGSTEPITPPAPTGPTIHNLSYNSLVGVTNYNNAPIYGLYNYSFYAAIIYIEELQALATQPEAFTGLEFQVSGYSTGYTKANQVLKMAHIQQTQFISTAQADLTNITHTDLTTVKNNYSQTFVNGWNAVNFDTNFEWNGVDSILVIFENRSGQWNSGYGWGESHTYGLRSTAYLSASQQLDAAFPTTQPLTRSRNRLNLKLKY